MLCIIFQNARHHIVYFRKYEAKVHYRKNCSANFIAKSESKMALIRLVQLPSVAEKATAFFVCKIRLNISLVMFTEKYYIFLGNFAENSNSKEYFPD